MRLDAGQTSELPQGPNEIQNTSPRSTVESASFVIREAQEGDAEFLRAWLSHTLVGTPAAQLLVVVERDGAAIVGTAAVRVFQDRSARFTVFVLPELRRRGCGRSLLASVRALAKQQSVVQLLSEWSNQVDAVDEPSLTATAFFRTCGLTVEQEVVSYRAELRGYPKNISWQIMDLRRMATAPPKRLVREFSWKSRTLARRRTNDACHNLLQNNVLLLG